MAAWPFQAWQHSAWISFIVPYFIIRLLSAQQREFLVIILIIQQGFRSFYNHDDIQTESCADPSANHIVEAANVDSAWT